MTLNSYTSTEELEETAFLEACSRLCLRRCHWRSCDAILNSVDNLLRHLFVHEDESGDYVCRWKDCTEISNDSNVFDKHLEDHATDPLPCAHLGCHSEFNTRHELFRHNRLRHNDNQLKPAPDPFGPQLTALAPIAQISERLPSPVYSSYLSVSPCSISPVRHAQIGPWVLRRIFGPVNLQHAQYNAAAPLRASRRLSDEDTDPKSAVARIGNSRHDEYDFAKEFTLDPPDFCDDLLSHEVTKLVREGGLVLWDTMEETEVKKDNDREITDPVPPSSLDRSPTQDASQRRSRPEDPPDDGASDSSDELRLRDNHSAERVVLNGISVADVQSVPAPRSDEEAVVLML